LTASGPCWEVNVADGIDESDTGELHALYACLNQTGNFDPLRGMVNAMDAQTRTGIPVGAAVAQFINGLDGESFSLSTILSGVGVMFEHRQDVIWPILELSVEVIYGKAYEAAERMGAPSSTSALESGLVKPILPVVASVASQALDELENISTAGAAVLSSSTVRDGVCLLVASHGTESVETAFLDNFIAHVGQGIYLGHSPDNDRWPAASGDSIRDLTEAMILNTNASGQSLVESVQDDLITMLLDGDLRSRLHPLFNQLAIGGQIDPIPSQLYYLANVNVYGNSLTSGQDSALLAMIRLLHSANAELSCEIDVLGFPVAQLEIDNLSVSILQTLAQQDPNSAADGVSLLASTLDWGVTEALLDGVSSSGICPMISSQFVDDLTAFDRLSDPQVSNLVVVVLELLNGFYQPDPTNDRIPQIVGIIDELYTHDTVQPIEELLRDINSSYLLDDLIDAANLLFSQNTVLDTRDCPTGSEPPNFISLWNAASTLFEPDDDGSTYWSDIQPIIVATVVRDGTWETLNNFASLAQDPDSHLHHLPQIVSTTVALYPDMMLLDNIGDLLQQPTKIQPLLMVMENEIMMESIGTTELTSEGPLPFGARLIINGTIDDVFRTIEVLFSVFEDTP